ncbi:MAG: thiol peroxidase [Candidatus Delongbacteria bacterium]|jgi:thiol peroxidase|nr:thiol peroxidase [Candidatus Delongbacteria bacterium]
MAKILLKGNPINTMGEIPKVGDSLKEFTLVTDKLIRVHLSDYKKTRLVLNIFPSLDTPTCAASVRYFNQAAGSLENTKVLCISRDLPFAQARFCGAEGLENVITLSDYVNGEFGKNYGLEIANGPLEGLHSRVVIIADENGKIIYTEQVGDIVDEPKYEAALKALK